MTNQLRQAAQQGLEALEDERYVTKYTHIVEAITALKAELAQPEQQAEPCIGKDPRCPCQDGDACHYKDCVGTKARPVAQPEQEPTQWRDMVVVSLVREGINKHKARELADHFATPPAAQRPWVGLTASTILNLMPSSIPADHDGALMEFARSIEAKLKKSNI
jgi:hypothetical protein